MQPAGDEAARRFVADLVRLRRDAGMPSYSTLERFGGNRLSRSTMSDILTGKRVRLAEWRFVAAFVTACRSAAGECGLKPDDLGTLATWKRRWDEAETGVTDAPYPGHADSRPAHGDDTGTAVRPGPVAVNVEPVPAWRSDPGPPADSDESPRPVTEWGPVPPRVHDFIGRQDTLEDLRRSLTGHADSGAVAIQGLGGIGKTQLAIEYTHRYRDEYDLVCWVPGISRATAVEGLAGVEIAGTAPAETGDRAAAVVEALRVGRPYARWLLVFDDADDPQDVRDLMPPGRGHVIVTTRNKRWNAFVDLLELDVLARDESVRFLRGRLGALSEADAHRLADAAGDLPLVLEHAVESRVPVEDYLAQLESAPRALLSRNQPSTYPVPVTESWDASIERLREESGDALEILRCCAFFGSGPIPLESLERGRYLPHSSVYGTLSDPIRRSRATIALGRTGLARVNSARRTIQVHRVVQSVVRDGLDEEKARQSRHDVHLLLAAADPGDPDDFDNWPRYEELRRHMDPSGVEACPDLAVRRFVLNMVRYLRIVGDPVAARTVADRALGELSETDADDVGAVPMRLALSRSKVDALIALGSYDEAFALCNALDHVASDLGEHEETVILGRTVGAEHRMRGRFAEALATDEESVAAHLRVFDRDHPQTFMATNNLAVDHALNGHYDDALTKDEEAYRDCLTFYGRNDHPAVLVYQNAMARSMRLAGHYRAALELAAQVQESYRSIIQREILSEVHPWVLTHANDLAATRKAAGVTNALSLAMDVRNQCWVFGVNHPQTLAVTVTLGSVLRGAGRLNEALDLTGDAARRYESVLGAGHPYTHACTADLAATRRQAGGPAQALGLVESALAGLRATVGNDHHYTLAAMVTHANILADLGGAETETALTVVREALDRLREALGSDHPHALAAEGNLSLVLSEIGDDEGATAIRAGLLPRYQRSLGERHPDVSRFVERQRLDIDFFPVPI